MNNKSLNQDNHIHTLSNKKTKLQTIWDVMIKHHRLIDKKSMTAKCSKCGALIRVPFAWSRYYKALLLFGFSLPHIATYMSYNILFRGLNESLNYVLAIAVAIIFVLLEFFVIPVTILALCPWVAVNTYNCTEEQAKKYEEENRKEELSEFVGYAFLGIFITILVKAYINHH